MGYQHIIRLTNYSWECCVHFCLPLIHINNIVCPTYILRKISNHLSNSLKAWHKCFNMSVMSLLYISGRVVVVYRGRYWDVQHRKDLVDALLQCNVLHYQLLCDVFSSGSPGCFSGCRITIYPLFPLCMNVNEIKCLSFRQKPQNTTYSKTNNIFYRRSGQIPFALSGVKSPDDNIDSPANVPEPFDTSTGTPNAHTVNSILVIPTAYLAPLLRRMKDTIYHVIYLNWNVQPVEKVQKV